MIPRPTEKYESGGRSTLYEMIAETAPKTSIPSVMTLWSAPVVSGNKPIPTEQAP